MMSLTGTREEIVVNLIPKPIKVKALALQMHLFQEVSDEENGQQGYLSCVHV